ADRRDAVAVLMPVRDPPMPWQPPGDATSLLRVREARLVQLHDPAWRRSRRVLQHREDPVPPPERRVLVDPQPPRRLPHTEALHHAPRVLAPQPRELRVGERRARQIAERAPAGLAAVALTAARLPPAQHLAAPAARAPQPLRE